MTDPMTAAGDMIYRNTSNATDKLVVGTAGQLMTVVNVGGTLLPQWAAAATGLTLGGDDTPAGQIQYRSSGNLAANDYFYLDSTNYDLYLIGSKTGAKRLYLRNTHNGTASSNGIDIGNDSAADQLSLRINSSIFTGVEGYSYLWSKASAPLIFGTADAEVMRLVAGNLAIGTTDMDGTPVIGRIVAKGSTNDGTTNIFVGRDSDEVNVFRVNTNGGIYAFNLDISGSGGIQIGAGGGLTWGTAYGSALANDGSITISGTSRVDSSGSAFFASYAVGATPVIDSSRNASFAALAVTGFRLGTSATAGRVLTADASGYGTYQAITACATCLTSTASWLMGVGTTITARSFLTETIDVSPYDADGVITTTGNFEPFVPGAGSFGASDARYNQAWFASGNFSGSLTAGTFIATKEFRINDYLGGAGYGTLMGQANAVNHYFSILDDNEAPLLSLVRKLGGVSYSYGQLDGDFLPAVDATYDLGSSGLRWSDIRAYQATISSTLYAGGLNSSTLVQVGAGTQLTTTALTINSWNVINSSGQFIGPGVVTTAAAIGGTGHNTYQSGWFYGQTATSLKMLTDLQDNSGTIEFKYRTFDVRGGVITSISAESAWTPAP